jgi:hypothetical protein
MFVIKSCSVRLSLLLLHCLSWEVKKFGAKGINHNIVAMPRRLSPVHIARPLSTDTGPEFPNIKLDERKTWNMKALKHDIERRQMRMLKKVAKADEKLQSFSVAPSGEPETAVVSSNPAFEEARAELFKQRRLLGCLNDLHANITDVKSAKDPLFAALVPEIIRLEISDQVGARKDAPVKAPKTKPKAPAPRLPYHVYESIEGIEIRVGRGAQDNDELSCNRAHRDGANWWMHVAGHPGSHVVIRSTEDNLLATHKQTVLDAAVLAAVNSKAGGGRVQVSLTRCRNVSKPAGAKAGLVQLTGDVHTVTVDVKGESKRLERLKKVDTSLS